MPIEEIEEVLNKYQEQELIVDSKLNEKNKKGNSVESNLITSSKITRTLESARNRNHQISKEVETVKGNLRSRAIFSPVEMEWKRICENYTAHPSLVVTQWKCDIPIFV